MTENLPGPVRDQSEVGSMCPDLTGGPQGVEKDRFDFVDG